MNNEICYIMLGKQDLSLVRFAHGTLKPSTRDRKTMKAWVDCFGRPLLCVIQNPSRATAYLVSSVKHKRWRYVWSRRALIYKILKYFGVYA